MSQVRIDELQEGMILSEDVLDGNGQVMMRAGAALTDRDLRRFRMWGVMEVGVDGDDDDQGEAAARSIDPELLAVCEAETQALFAHTNLNHPLMALLYEESLHRLARERSA